MVKISTVLISSISFLLNINYLYYLFLLEKLCPDFLAQ